MADYTPTFYAPGGTALADLEAWVTHLKDNPGKIPFLPRGTYSIDATWTITNLSHRTIYTENGAFFDNPASENGQLNPGVVIKWTGGASGPMILLDQCLGLQWQSLVLWGQDNATIGLRITDSAGYGSHRHHFDRWGFKEIASAVEIGNSAATGQGNSDLMRFSMPTFSNCDYGITTWGEQQLLILVECCNAGGVGTVFRASRGGHFQVNTCNSIDCDVLFDPGQGGTNAYANTLINCRLDSGNVAGTGIQRFVKTSTAADIVEVNLIGCAEAAPVVTTDYLIDVEGGVCVNVLGGHVSSRLARLRGTTGKTARVFAQGTAIAGNTNLYTVAADPGHFITRDCRLNTNTTVAPLSRTSD